MWLLQVGNSCQQDCAGRTDPTWRNGVYQMSFLGPSQPCVHWLHGYSRRAFHGYRWLEPKYWKRGSTQQGGAQSVPIWAWLLSSSTLAALTADLLATPEQKHFLPLLPFLMRSFERRWLYLWSAYAWLSTKKEKKERTPKSGQEN